MQIDSRCFSRTALALVALCAVRCGDDNSSKSGAIGAPAAGVAGTVTGASTGAGGVGTAGPGAAARGTAGVVMASAAGAASSAIAGKPTPAGAGGSGPTAAAGGQAGASVAGASVAGASVAGASGAAGVSAMAGAGAAGSTASAGAWPAADVGAAGPFMTTTVMNSGPSNGYALYFPTDLGRDGLKHPIVTWGNGAGSTPGQYTLLPRIASHGFVVIASNSSSVTGALLKGGIDWLITENGREGSMFKDKLDPNQVASMGYSLGSLATFEIAGDMRIKTTIHISGGSMTKSVVANLHAPAAFYCGNDSDIAFNGCEGDFEITKVPTIYANFPGDHLGVRNAKTAPQVAKATVGWLRWRLMADKTLDAMFVGPDCGLCKDMAWEKVQQKMLAVPPP